MKLKIEGLGRLQRALTVVASGTERAVERAVVQTSAAIQRRYVAAVQRGGRSGRTYQKYAPRRTHQASAPGEAPKTDTGRLAGSAVVLHVQGTRSAEVAVTAPYAAALEFGSPRSNLAPRPALGPAVEAEKRLFRDRVAEQVNAALRAKR